MTVRKFEIDKCSESRWHQCSTMFSNMNIYQNWYYGYLHSQGIGRSVIRIIQTNNDVVELLAQIRIKKIPFTNIGVAEVDCGPIWDMENFEKEKKIFVEFLEFIKREICEKRKYEILVNLPSSYCNEIDRKVVDVIEENGFQKSSQRPYQTYTLDLTRSLEDIRKGFHQKWRNMLNKAEKSDLEFEYGYDHHFFDRFYSIYQEMRKRKGFPTGVRVPIIREIQKNLPADQRLLITIVKDSGQDVGATVCASFGNTLHYFLGATSLYRRIKSNPGYLLQWLNIQKGKELGFERYDLGGFDEVKSPDLNRFKKRMGGEMMIFPGTFAFSEANLCNRLYHSMESLYRCIRRVATKR